MFAWVRASPPRCGPAPVLGLASKDLDFLSAAPIVEAARSGAASRPAPATPPSRAGERRGPFDPGDGRLGKRGEIILTISSWIIVDEWNFDDLAKSAHRWGLPEQKVPRRRALRSTKCLGFDSHSPLQISQLKSSHAMLSGERRERNRKLGTTSFSLGSGRAGRRGWNRRPSAWRARNTLPRGFLLA
jgi:hypothetical protein